MSSTTSPERRTDAAASFGFFVNAGTHAGWFTTPDGHIYDIRKLQPREVKDASGAVAMLWGAFAMARDRDVAARDAILQAAFKKTRCRPPELFAAEARDIPLYLTLRRRPGKSYSDIGSFWNAQGRYTVFARDMNGRHGLRFGGTVVTWRPPAERAST